MALRASAPTRKIKMAKKKKNKTLGCAELHKVFGDAVARAMESWEAEGIRIDCHEHTPLRPRWHIIKKG